MDLQLARKLLDDVLTHPISEDHRTVFISHINADWIGKTFFTVCIQCLWRMYGTLFVSELENYHYILNKSLFIK